MFIDETGASTNMARTRGRARRGTRLIGLVPHGHWKITTFVAGLRCGEITAPFVIDRPMNGAIFVAYIRQCLVPTLAKGDIVVIDNRSSHKVLVSASRHRNIERRTIPHPHLLGNPLPIQIRRNLL